MNKTNILAILFGIIAIFALAMIQFSPYLLVAYVVVHFIRKFW